MYDVFISFKNSVNGIKTEDSTFAMTLYNELTNRGVKVFMSNQSLNDLGVSEYKKVIDEALDTTKSILVLGAKLEYLDSQWVKYEWDSFVNDVISGIKPNGKIFSYIGDFEISTLPRSLRQYQVFKRNNEDINYVINYIMNALDLPIIKKEQPTTENKIRLLGHADIIREQINFFDLVSEVKDVIYSTLENLPTELFIDVEPSIKIMERSTDTWKILMSGDKVIGHWFFVTLYDEEFERAIKGELHEEEISYENINYINLPGFYRGYFLQIEILKEYQSFFTFKLLFDSFLEQLERFAKEGVFISEWCAVAESPEGIALCKSLGMDFVCNHKIDGKMYHGKFLPFPNIKALHRNSSLVNLYKEAEKEFLF